MQNLERQLRDAALIGDLEEVKRLIKEGVPVNAPDTFNNTPLLHATRRGKTGCIRFLIDQGADVNMANKNGYSPLLAAVVQENTESVNLLLEAGADVNQKCRSEDMTPDWYTTPMKVAVRRHNPYLIEVLKQHSK